MVTSFAVCCLLSQRLPAGRFLFARGMALSSVLDIQKAVVPQTPDSGRHYPFPHNDSFESFRKTQ